LRGRRLLHANSIISGGLVRLRSRNAHYRNGKKRQQNYLKGKPAHNYL
jgi:hypothetical protein